MLAFPTLLSSILLFILLIIPGFILGKAKAVEKNALNSLTNILMYIAMPFLVFAKLLTTDLCAISIWDILFCVLVPAVIILIVYAAAVVIFRKKDSDTRFRPDRFCAVFSNCGFLGIPLSEVLFPNDPKISVYVSLFNVTSTFLLLTFGVYILSGDKKNISFRHAVISPIAISIIVGVIFSLTNIISYVPQVKTYADLLSGMTTPLSMIVLGVELSELRFTDMIKTLDLYSVSALKLILSPLAAIIIMLLLKLCGASLSQEVMAAIFLASAVSTAASASAMSKKYGADGEHAAILTLGTTLLCALTLPGMYMLFELILL